MCSVVHRCATFGSKVGIFQCVLHNHGWHLQGLQKYFLLRKLWTGDFAPQNYPTPGEIVNFASCILQSVSIWCSSTNIFKYIQIYLNINNGNRTEWSPIWSVIIQVITKLDDCEAGVQFVITSMITDWYRTTWSPITNRPFATVGHVTTWLKNHH